MTRAGVRLAAIAAACVIVGCTDINGSADHVASLEFSTLPYPAVVAGDTLRDSLGVATPLRAVAYNGGGATIDDAELEYIALDTGLTITSSGLVIARRRSGSVPIIASSSALQSPRLTLQVARSPDSVAISGKARDTIIYDFNAPTSTPVSGDLGVKVITKDTTGGVTGTQGWIVSYQLAFRNATIAPGDTSVLWLSDGTKRSTLDTTATGGTAARKVRLNLLGFPGGVDSATVTATVRYKGQQVRGSPLRFVILLRPK
jgi:hypothetical protein